ncbi:MAG: 30S ribosomal protein S6 [Kiritimatiellae bacterium]|nr:30S ribosomal protein S6 [Kiritimatiellia bacterium]
MKKYDGLYIFAGSARDEVLDKAIESATAEITNLSGKILSTEVLGKKTFARPMKKRDNGVFVKIRFELAPTSIAALTRRYKLVDEVFRVQILAVDERLEAMLVQQAEDAKVREAAKAAAAAEAALEESAVSVEDE